MIPGYDPEATAQPGDWFDEAAAKHAIDFIEQCCRHIEGSMAGELFILEPWQRAVIGCLFGWKRGDVRRYREVLLYIPRGNGKTPILAAIALYMLFCDGERGAQIYFVASEREQAAIAYKHASGMVTQNEALEDLAQVFKGSAHRSIVRKDDPAASIRVVTSDAGSKHGYNPHLVVGDEVHAWEDFELMEALETAFAKKGRRQPLKLWATTADYDRPSVCNEKYDYAVTVRDNDGDPMKPGYDSRFLPVIFEATVDDDWTKPETWEKANPNIDVTVDRESLASFVRLAIEQPRKQAEFKRLHLNIRTTSQHVYIPLERWDLCDRETPDDWLIDRPCFGGLDVSSKQDITAFVLVFPPYGDDPCYVVRPWFWIPDANMVDREHRDNVPYRAWVEAGLVRVTDGDIIDEAAIKAHILDCRSRYFIQEVAYDKWNAQGMGTDLHAQGVNMLDHPQTMTQLTAGTKGLDDLVAQRLIAHGGNPVMRWMLGCTETKSDYNQNIRPVKPDKASGKRIDGVVATVMAVGRALANSSDGSNQPQCMVF